MTKSIYFLCTGNSCRSQMAQGFGKEFLTDRHVYSAGIEAHGVHQKAVETMKEIGIDISGQSSDTIDMELLHHADMVVTLCGHANDVCPAVPPHVRREHWEFDDPAREKGTEEEKLAAFRRVRDEMQERIRRFAVEQ
ncbi:arsenate reductase (thioredoxin) [Salibacterium halotolerans]|uniref:Arsenate reductase n=1 Tax=Salibacterium halotolerans TaxID=1884432 RepID=A0A1I5SW09_9BACI|nr:arsenate reductase (thioredoxin) [Salibacterium halotolerans]SFP74406.1 arsenate reductase [Salibacterium halotolerans]